MELEKVKRYLEKGDYDDQNKNKNKSAIEGMPLRFFERFIMQGIHVDLVERGRLLCSMKVPPRLLNSGNFLHGGATATLVDLVGSAVIFTVGAPFTGVSVEINVSYLDAAYLDVSLTNSIQCYCGVFLYMEALAGYFNFNSLFPCFIIK
ncbi:uncharacterized protein LOC126673128 [Mercurialis annua]|uniref:uncharacterized protein LOC126673128 n=1 Tax=Mercurialis annua TaxID=3986 RepID=UPI00215EA2C5|nr:uncharacterized protein LOC126673128 [Mercurialis annua]